MRESSDWISAAADQGVAMDFAGVLGMETGPSRDDSLSNAGPCVRLRSTPVDFDSALEPMTRCRANTWPCRPNDSVVDEENRSTPTSVDGDQPEGAGCRDPSLGGGCGGAVGPGGLVGTRKAAARRNAWGNLSYADLITRAIESSPEKRLTLSQIYSWMVENVPFFKDKGDSNSSAGWKNSIRHNLSLHSRFMRVQNESTGKSSWWVINPDVKTLKTPRRRAATMDNTKVAMQHRRNRLKGGGLPRVSSSDRSLMGYGYDSCSSEHMDASNLDPDMLGISSQNYRVRSSSNASSIGRLSPILATAEQDAEESQFRMSLPSSALPPWNGLCLPPESGAETLSESLASIFVEDPKKSNLGGEQCHGSVMGQNGSVMTPSRGGGIMTLNGGSILGQNAGNIMSTGSSGVNTLGQNRNMVQNGVPMMGGMPSYSHGAVGMESGPGGHMAMGHHHMWSIYRGQQPSNVFPSSPLPGDVGNKMIRYNGDVGYPMRHMVPRHRMGFYEENAGPRYAQFGVPGIGSAGSQYGSPALSELLKQEHKPTTSCYFAGSNGDHDVGMTSPLTSCVKSEHPSMGVYPGERQGMTQWPEQQQQQQQQQHQSPRPMSVGRPLGPIDPRKLMKILAEKPHLKEKMLQLIQQKRQQLTLLQQQPQQQQQQQQVVNSTTHPGSTPPSYLNATTMSSHQSEALHPKQEMPSHNVAAHDSRPLSGPSSSCRSVAESSMPVDLDLDFEANPVINCDIDQVIQHELTFGELDFSLDQLQVTVANSSFDFASNFRF